MAGNTIQVSTDQVHDIANKIDTLNKQLSEKLREGQKTVDNLTNIWEGEAAQATVENFDSFANEYFQKWEDVINQYVMFLNKAVETGYTELETQNINLADSFK